MSRSLDQIHYDVQLQCGMELINGKIAEMKTGEGKTLTASLVAFLIGLKGKGLHVVTFNDYLAERDCEFLRPVYRRLGLSVSVVGQDVDPHSRKSCYDADITYGSAKEFGFDFLRDRMRIASTNNPKSGVMRGLEYALVDEADSILIDEARTPLVIGTVNQQEEKVRQGCYSWAASHADRFSEQQHFRYDELKHKVTLNAQGIQLSRGLPQNQWTKQVSIRELYDYLEKAIKVRRDFHRDKHYAVIDDEVVIIDEYTGRPAEGRQWQGGIHQSVQAKEQLPVTPQNQQAASITIQSLFKKYRFFCGMTGTAWTSRRELKKVYRKQVARIPTHRPVRRTQFPTRVFADQNQKFQAISAAAQQIINSGRSILIGTRSVEKSELLATFLERQSLNFQILNARNLEREAEIVAEAGRSRKVTIATNMAGRGTDIKLDEQVRQSGGLHVVLSEIHESQRIDWQLIGRGSRQGDPGSFQIFVSLDDEILITGLGQQAAGNLVRRYAGYGPEKLSTLFHLFRKAQRRAERRHLTDRMMVLKADHERQKSLFETGQDPYLSTVTG